MSRRGSAEPKPPPRHSRLTRRGWCLLTLALPLLATLLLPVWEPRPYAAALGIGLLLALALARWRAPRALQGVSGEWVLPRAAHALAPTTVGARLAANRGTPPFALFAWQPTERELQVAARLAGLQASSLRGGLATRVSWITHFPRRGTHALPALTVTTSQPFGLVSTSARISPIDEMLVFPALGQIRRAFEIELRRWMETHPLFTQAGNDELAHLRPYRPGDHPHSVHWKASARRQSLLVMERHAAGSRKLALVLDTSAGAKVWKLERLISIAATLVDYFCAKGWSLTLYGLFAPTGIQGSRESLLESLALAEMQTGGINAVIPERDAAIVLVSEPLLEAPPNAWVMPLAACEELIALPAGVH